MIEETGKQRAGRWAVVINRSAGGSDAEADRLLGSVKAVFAEEGIEADFHLVSGAEVEGICREALEKGVAGVAAGGGDGTLSAVAGLLAGGEVPMAVLPLGTLNHFAKDLGIPLDLPGAVQVIAKGRVSRIDLGEVNGTLFLNNSSIGGYPWIIRTREMQRQQFGRSKWLAHLVAFIGFLKRFRTMRVTLELDGKTVSRRTPFVCVGNNEYALDAVPKVGRPSLNDGCLSVYWARCDHWTQFLGLFGLLLTKRLADHPEFETHRVAEAMVATRKNRQHVSWDGEVELMEMPLHYRIRREALAVMVPEEEAEK